MRKITGEAVRSRKRREKTRVRSKRGECVKDQEGQGERRDREVRQTSSSRTMVSDSLTRRALLSASTGGLAGPAVAS